MVYFWAGAAVLLFAAAIVAVEKRREKAELLSIHPMEYDIPSGSWWANQLSSAAIRVLNPAGNLLPSKDKASKLKLLNPGELSGDLKDPDDPWGYSTPRCRGLPTCSDSTSHVPAVGKRQQALKVVRSRRGRESLSDIDKDQARILRRIAEGNHVRAAPAHRSSSASQLSAAMRRSAGMSGGESALLELQRMRSEGLLTSHEFTRLKRHVLSKVQHELDELAVQGKPSSSSLKLLNPGELSGDLKDPDDPWGYSTPRCRGLPTCSDSTSHVPAVGKRQQALSKKYS
uniref:SHOCT domain-containing protein n=1 Tax=Guillardia theta TaxID=55529 RepID=A0A7S4J7I8_GUITH